MSVVVISVIEIIMPMLVVVVMELAVNMAPL